jgi:hypothetical protein
LGLWVALKDKSLHQAIGSVDSFLDKFLDSELIDELMLQKGLFNFFPGYRILSYFITYQKH